MMRPVRGSRSALLPGRVCGAERLRWRAGRLALLAAGSLANGLTTAATRGPHVQAPLDWAAGARPARRR